MSSLKTLHVRYTRMIDVTGPAGTLLVGCVAMCGLTAMLGWIAG